MRLYKKFIDLLSVFINMSAVNTYRLQPVHGEGKAVRKRKHKAWKREVTDAKLRKLGAMLSAASSKNKKEDMTRYTGGFTSAGSEEKMEKRMSDILKHKKLMEIEKWKLYSDLFTRHVANQLRQRSEAEDVQRAVLSATDRS